MKQYLPYIIVAALTFAICFAVDSLSKRRRRGQPARRQVKPRRTTVVFGLVLSFFGLGVGLRFLGQDTLITVCSAGVLLMGVGLLYVYGATAIVYDDEGFTDKAPFRRPKRHDYGDIRGERALMTRSGVNAMLYAGQDEVHIYQSMEGVQEFLKTAYHGWLAQTGRTQDDCPPPNATYLVWFPEPEETEGDSL